MFIKRCTRRKNGKHHTYWQLVESYRTARGPRHRTVAYLGELDPCEKKGWARLADQLDGKAARKAQRQMLLFETLSDDTEAEPIPDSIEIDLKSVRVMNTRDFGDVFLALTLWNTLGLDEFFANALEIGREDVPWALMACIPTLGRFVEPNSELHVEDTWYRRTALSSMLGVHVDKVNDSRLYRTLDKVLPLKQQIEQHLKQRVGELFTQDFDLLLYDVTSTYFEGHAQTNPQAQRGHSRDHRPDCKQVCIGLVVTRDGFPLAYEVFAGNRSDVTTVEEMVLQMETKYGQANRIWVMDRGMVSEDNLAFIRSRKGFYLVGTPRRMLKSFEQYLLDQEWTEVQEGIDVKLVRSPESEETFVLCRSQDRRLKEQAMHTKFADRIERGLRSMEKDLLRARKPRDHAKLERRIGRLFGSNSRAAGCFRADLIQDPRLAGDYRLQWSKQDAWLAWSQLSEGCYLLRTNLVDQSPEDLWKTYIQLTDVEAVFRTEKTALRIRPIWHQREHRVQGHILFSFLAYALWKAFQIWMERSGLGRGVRTVQEELARIKSADVQFGTSEGRQIRISCVTQPDAAQRALLDRLGLILPERLGRPRWIHRPDKLNEM
jgi:transposase